MVKKVWKFELEGRKHEVELEYSGMWGKIETLLVDGKSVKQIKRKLTFRKSEHPFKIGKHNCAVVLRSALRGYESDLLVDGRLVEIGQEISKPKKRDDEAEKILGVFAAILTGAMVFTMGIISGIVGGVIGSVLAYFLFKRAAKARALVKVLITTFSGAVGGGIAGITALIVFSLLKGIPVGMAVEVGLTSSVLLGVGIGGLIGLSVGALVALFLKMSKGP